MGAGWAKEGGVQKFNLFLHFSSSFFVLFFLALKILVDDILGMWGLHSTKDKLKESRTVNICDTREKEETTTMVNCGRINLLELVLGDHGS